MTCKGIAGWLAVTLTSGADKGAAFTGGSGNDAFSADYDVNAAAGKGSVTLNALDEIDGGAGVNTLNITDNGAKVNTVGVGDDTGGTAGYVMANAKISNIQNITIKGADDVTANVSGSNITGLEKISVLKSAAATVTASATQNVEVSGATGAVDARGGKDITITDSNGVAIDVEDTVGNYSGTFAAGAISVTSTKQTGQIDIDGGSTVTVVASSDKATAGAINIGANKVATGAVSVTKTVTNNAVGAINSGTVTINGGSTVAVDVSTTNTASVGNNGAITADAIAVTGDTATTTVNVKQTHVANDYASVTTGAKAETAAVTFGSLKSGEKVAISEGALTAFGTDLTFTASKDLTAAEVAAAFASLTAQDYQASGGVVANGIFTGRLDAGWTSAGASGATVTFSGTTKVAKTDLVVTAKKADGTTDVANVASFTIAKVDGDAGTSTTAVDLTTNPGTVAVLDKNATTKTITSVTIDGFNTVAVGVNSTNTNQTVDKLATLNLSNSISGATVNVATAATALTLNLNKVAGTVNPTVNLDHDGNLTAAGSMTIKDLTVNATGTASAIALQARAVENLVINADVGLTLNASSAIGNNANNLATVDINGAGAVNIGTIASTGLKSFDAAGNTGGVTATVTAATAGVHADFTKYVFSGGADTVTLSSSTVQKNIELGAGNDKITLASGTTALTGTIDGGTDTNTLHMDAADAATAASDPTFEGKISNFQKLSLGAVAGAADLEVDLANMDDISYVISANTTAASAARATETTVTFGALTAGQSLTLGGLTLTAYGNIASGTVASAFASLANGATGANPANGTFTGSFSTDWTSGAATGNDVKFTNDATGAIAAITTTEAGALAAPVITYLFTDGADGASAGKVDMTFGALAIGQSYTVLGVTVTAKTAQLDTAVAAKILAALDATTPSTTSDANFLVSGTVSTAGLFTGWTLGTFSDRTTVVGATLTITDGAQATATDDPTAAAISSKSAIVAAPGDLAETAVVGAAAGAVAAGALELSHMANDGTLELTAAGAGATVTMKDAIGGADSFNIVTKVNASDLIFGTLTVAGVETIDITATDTTPVNTTTGAATISKATLTLTADDAKTVNIDGNSDVEVILASSTKVTKVDATNLTGALTLTANGATAGTEVIGGSAADVLATSGNADVIDGRAGKDLITVAVGDNNKIIGGAGADVFTITGSSSTDSVYAIFQAAVGDTTNVGVTSGDQFIFNSTVSGLADTFVAQKIELAVGATQSTQAYIAKALGDLGADDMGWFQYGGNTFIVRQGQTANSEVFSAADGDQVVMIVGQVNLDTGASFNSTIGSLEIV